MAAMVSLALVLTAGCGSNDVPGSTQDSAKTTESTDANEQDDGETKPEGGQETADGDVVSLELVCGHGVALPEKEKNFVEQGIREAIGVDVTMNIVGAGADYATALNARISGGDVPDLFIAPSDETLKQYVQNGIVLSLNDYLDQLQPLVDWGGGEEALRPNYINGGMYRVPRKAKGSYSMPVVRKDWLDKVGAEIPTTMEEALEVAKKFTFEDPDGNGAQDTYGFSGNGLWAFNLILNSYGGSVYNNLVLDENGELTSTLLAPNMEAGLEMCKRFVDAGVVDPDIVANSGDALRDKMAQCKVGMAVTEWASVYKQALMEQLLAVDPDAEWVWYAPLDSGTGDRACFDTINAVGSKGEWCVSAAVAESPEKLEAVIKLLNYITSEEGEKLVSYGVEGRHYNVENGEIVKTDLMSTECDFLWVYQMAYRDDGVYLAVKFPEAAESIVFSENTERMTAYENAVIAPEGFHAEDMNKYITENMIAFIFGTRPISEYSQFLEELNTSFGFEDYMKSAEEQLREQGYIE